MSKRVVLTLHSGLHGSLCDLALDSSNFLCDFAARLRFLQLD